MKSRPEYFLNKFTREKHAGDLHITRMFGALVAVSQGKVIGLEDYALRYCPLAARLYDGLSERADDATTRKQAIARSVEAKIKEFGHFTHRRMITRKAIAAPYGASEMLMYALKKKKIDCAVTVCDCAGTVISNTPEVVQGIGARMNGLFFTSPVRQVIHDLENHGAQVVFPKTADINQEEGIKKAARLDYKSIAVTVNGFGKSNLKNMRELEEKLGISVTLLTVCTTGITLQRAKELARYSDLVWSCASEHIRGLGRDAVLQITSGIPVFVFTQKGLDFVSAYCADGGKISGLEPTKKYLISGIHGGQKIIMGDCLTYLSEMNALPIRGKKEPCPLL